MTAPIRLLVVDDSSFMRLAIRKMLEGDAEIRVVGEAPNGPAAIDLARALQPDVVTMDVEMPGMDGVDATRAIVAERPVPVIMLSSLTQRGSRSTLAALDAGAVDFISKSTRFSQFDIVEIDRELREKVRYWGRHDRATTREAAGAPPPLRPCPTPATVGLVVVAASTGGPRTVAALLAACGPILPPMVIAQHMPPAFGDAFAGYLRDDTALDVREGHDGTALRPGSVTLIPGGQHGRIGRTAAGGLVLRLALSPLAALPPSADLLFESAATAGADALAVVLTGLGHDGTEGAAAFAARDLPVLVQDPDECAAGSMPRSVLAAGYATHCLGLDPLAATVRAWCGG